ncbi:hypothetical protein BZA05DRAFT_476585 [Tricharina praecox]|uniref:uncharacterized protein n=1 Tax=Tricharina praecox TaxID=43433 RepID=UPI00221E5A47|nr:uncharacterized protein BZA05DRAFT_476585 [Tricharina praecox]KAI5845421.1 hypothetical protein BZA05DRAFT_476585 [Tricharina praecox]
MNLYVGLLVFFVPVLYQKAQFLYRGQASTIPLPATTKRLLDILFLSSILFLALSTPYFAPENVYLATKTDLSTHASDVFTALSTYRNLTSVDTTLRTLLSAAEGRLIYAWVGPTPLLHCSWCSFSAPQSFLIYAAPRILLPHLLHAAFIGVLTNGRFGRFGPYWRFYASVPMLALPAYELWRLQKYQDNIAVWGWQTNWTTVWHYWSMRTVRLVGFAAIDALLGLVLWLSATRRWMLGWEGVIAEERVDEALKKIQNAATLMQVGGLLKQTVMRDPELRGKSVEWWIKEDSGGKELMRDEEVMEVRKERLPNRVNLDSLREEAEGASRNWVSLMSNLARQREQAQGKPHQQ